MFAIIFFRLWFLQVLSGDKYLAQAAVNRVRNIDVPAARGEILDRNGNVLVNSKRAIAVQISPPDLPAQLNSADLGRTPVKDARLYARLAGVLRMPTARERCPVDGRASCGSRRSPAPSRREYAQLPYANVTIKTDVSNARPLLPRGAPEPVPGRRRPADLAAHLPAARRSPPSCSGRSDRSAPPSSRRRGSTGCPRTRSSASRGSSGTTTTTCRGATGRTGSRSTRSAASPAS